MKRLFATPSAIASNVKSEWERLFAKICKQKSKSERNRVLLSAPRASGRVRFGLPTSVTFRLRNLAEGLPFTGNGNVLLSAFVLVWEVALWLAVKLNERTMRPNS